MHSKRPDLIVRFFVFSYSIFPNYSILILNHYLFFVLHALQYYAVGHRFLKLYKKDLVIRITGYTFDFMKRSTRKQRAYKIDDAYYEVAQKKAALTEKPLAVRIEEFVIKYSGVEKTPYFAAMGDLIIKKSKNK